MTGVVSTFLTRYLLVPIVALWVYHLLQRRYVEAGSRKRNATLYLTVVLLGVWVLCWLLSRFALQDLYLIPIAFFAIVLLAWQRRVIFPYRLRCVSCGLPLSASRVLFFDSNACERCEPSRREGENR
ncbi:MAG TPA: hypothetical protein VL354_18135 [Spirochaetia bacterium]|nr:hypothetical protein [Spirochaetia bacterium]